MNPREKIKEKALALGFDAVEFAPATLAPEAGERLQEFVAKGYHGDMGWLAERMEQRRSPDALWSDAKSVVVLGLNYAPDHNPMDNLAQTDKGNISVYARHRDYHDVIKKKLRVLARWMAETFSVEVKLFVDTAPVMEKPLAQNAGLGWQGKHTNVVSREFGSWLFLGEVFTTLDLMPNTPAENHCGRCSRCLEICPTQAIIAPYQLDARRCISYLTIEHKGHIPRDLRPLMGNRIYGCDDCLSVCPWNRFATPCATPELQAKPEHTLPFLVELAALDDAAFRLLFSGSPVKRIGRDRFVRNVLIALGNQNHNTSLRRRPESVDSGFRRNDVECVVGLLNDPSPLVRAASIWALSRLDPMCFAAEKHRATTEPDPDVAQEWDINDAPQLAGTPH